MQNAHENLSWLTLFPGLNNLDLAAKDLLSKYVRIVEAPIGTIGYRDRYPLRSVCDAPRREITRVQNLDWWA